MKSINFPIYKTLGGIFSIGALILSVPLLTQAKFDPASVQPRGCKVGDMKCGYTPPSRAVLDAVPLADSNFIRHRGLPSKVDLSADMPPVGNQGEQGSCVAWSTGYAIKSYQEQVERQWGYDSPVTGGKGNHVFSPAFIYNQINEGKDNGSYVGAAMKLMVNTGSSPWQYMPYDVKDYRKQPSTQAKREASKYRADSYKRLKCNTASPIKAELSKGNPVVAGILVYDSFYQLGKNVYDSNSGQFYGGHAIALVGYDDNKKSTKGHVGAFKLFNSWSRHWGDQGYGWVSYKHMTQVCKSAMVMYDRQDAKQEPNSDAPVVDPGQTAQLNEIKAPTQITATSGSYSNRVDIIWNAMRGVVAYEVQRAEPSATDFFSIGKSQANNFSDTAVQSDVAYRYRIVSIGLGQRSDPNLSPVAEGYAKSTKQKKTPSKVVGLKGEPVSQKRRTIVKLTWNRVPHAKKYKAIRWDARKNRWKLLSGFISSSFFIDKRPPKGGMQYYRVRAMNRSGEGEWSDAVPVQIGGKQTPPSKVKNLTASRGIYSDHIRIKWSPTPTASKYYIFRYDSKNKKWNTPFQSRKTSYSDFSPVAKSGEALVYVVVAANSAGHSKYSAPVTGNASPHMKRAGEILNPPVGLVGKINQQRKTIALKWQPVKGASEYYIFRKRETDSDFTFLKGLPAPHHKFVTSVPVDDNGTMYFYTVRSKSALGGESGNSNIIAGFINPRRSIIRHRFLPGDGLSRFQGKWTAVDWDGESGPRDLILQIEGTGSDFTGSYQEGNNPPKSFSGSYVTKSDFLEIPGFKMEIIPEDDGTGVVDLKNSKISPNEVRIAFLKEE